MAIASHCHIEKLRLLQRDAALFSRNRKKKEIGFQH
jgi:hypothetical protein